ncbi:MAG: hypothetical protein H8E00_00210 [Deltaproteobacteria bacterium]|nr:hypothetical protein [Deltaproteobacteria bacterium]
MEAWTIIGVVIGVLALLFAIFLHVNRSIDKKIEIKLSDPEFLRKVANRVKLPFVIFDEDNSIVVDTGAMGVIDEICIKKADRNEVSMIIVSPKKYLAVAPILESLDPKIEFQYPTKGDKFDFIYKRVEMDTVWENTYESKPPKSRFRLQIIVLPEN